MHKIDMNPELIERVTRERNGRLHIFDEIDPARTAHLIVDLQNGFMERGAPVEVPVAREIIPSVNAISNAVRQAGGVNIFIQFTTPTDALQGWSSFYARFPPESRKAHQEAFAPDGTGIRYVPGLDVYLAGSPGHLLWLSLYEDFEATRGVSQ